MSDPDATAVFAANLCRLRTAQKLSQARLGGKAGVSAACISKIECGKSDPTIATASMLAQALGTDLAAMLTGEQTVTLTRIPVSPDGTSRFGPFWLSAAPPRRVRAAIDASGGDGAASACLPLALARTFAACMVAYADAGETEPAEGLMRGGETAPKNREHSSREAL